jgi:hydroxymethylpyrimidine pyrophosphatase-like HAD family hydrolase
LADYYQFTNLILENGNVVLNLHGSRWVNAPLWAEKHSQAWEIFDEAVIKVLKTVNIIETSSLSHVNREKTFNTLLIPGNDVPVFLELNSRALDLKSVSEESLALAAEPIRSILADYPITFHEVNCRNCITFGFADKADGVLFVANQNSPNPLHSAAMGDGLNDLEMLKKVDIPCCPANSHSLVKYVVNQRGGIVARSRSSDGVAEVLNRFAYSNGKGDCRNESHT